MRRSSIHPGSSSPLRRSTITARSPERERTKGETGRTSSLRIDPRLADPTAHPPADGRFALLHRGGEDLLHDSPPAPAGRVAGPFLVAPAVRPDGVHDATERRYSLVVARLIAI